MPAGGRHSSLIHELGRCIGMAANPDEVGIDGHQNHFSLNGDHCSNGLPRTAANTRESYETLANQDAPGFCVMFGYTSDVYPRLTFCSECRDTMKKINIS